MAVAWRSRKMAAGKDVSFAKVGEAGYQEQATQGQLRGTDGGKMTRFRRTKSRTPDLVP